MAHGGSRARDVAPPDHLLQHAFVQVFSALHSVSPKHAFHGEQQLATVHWLHAADGVQTPCVQSPFDGPAPPSVVCMSVHDGSQLCAQHASILSPLSLPFGYFASHAAMHWSIVVEPVPPSPPIDPLELVAPIVVVPLELEDEPLDPPVSSLVHSTKATRARPATRGTIHDCGECILSS
jgi:hypothetical protein